MPGPTYTYRAVAVRTIDGDTAVFAVDLGFNIWAHDVTFRLLGCNAIEHNQPGGAEARDHLASLLPGGTRVTLRSVKPDKYGSRYDAQITLADGTDLVTQLCADGWAAPWSGRGPKPVPAWPRVPLTP